MKTELCLPAPRKHRHAFGLILAALLSLPVAATAADALNAKAKGDKGPKSAGIKFSQNRGLPTAPFNLPTWPRRNRR